MLNGTKRPVVVSTRAFVGRRFRRFVLVAVTVNLLLCLLFLAVVTRANSTQICSVVGINIQSYIDSLSREIVIGNQEHLAMILDTLKSNKLLQHVTLSGIDVASKVPEDTQCQLSGMNIDFRMPVTFGQRQVGVLKGNIVWLPVEEILIFLGVAALFLLFFMWISTRLLLKDLHRALITPIWKLARGEVLSDVMLTSDVLKIKRDLEASHDNAKYAAVAQLTQMLAHDVRKPFSMIQIVLQSASAAQTLAGMKSIIYSGSQEINHALTSVTGMLNDIMEIGKDNTPSRELVSPKSLIHISLQEAGRLFSDSNITFSTSFEHTYLLEINPIKVQRVFSNIVENAVQAMKGEGHIWFHTTAPDRNGFVELAIGNSNSYIEPDDEHRLFDGFFTKGKEGGTGLGLAIAKKIVTAHGGQIGCRIIDKKGVEFWFTLPASKQIDAVHLTFPTSIMAFQESMSSVHTVDVGAFSEDVLSEKYETEIVRKLNGRRIKLLVLDDEEVYRDVLIRLVQQLERISPSIDLLVATSCNEALAHSVSKPDIGLFDYDLGEASLNGIDTLKLIRQRVPGICVCIHSNHIGGRQYKEAVEAGAHDFLPKPISKIHLLKIITNSLNVHDVHMANNNVPEQSYSAKAPALSADTRLDSVVAVVDDSEFNCRAWVQMNIGRPLMTFETPEMFWQYAEKNPDFFNSLTLIITDHFFGAKSAITGVEFAKNMMDKLIDKPVFLSSVGDFSNALPIPGIAGILPEKVMKWDELHAFCATVSRAQFVGNTYSARTDAVPKKGEEGQSDRINKAEASLQDRLKVKFFISAIEIIDEIDRAIQQQDMLQVADLAHKLQGSASIVGAHEMVHACQKLYYRQLSEREFIALLQEAISTMEEDLRSEGIIF